MSRKFSLAFVTLCLVIPTGIAAWIVIIYPDNFIVRMARAPINQQMADAKVITGPFPLESDFEILRSNGVTTIISLLNPSIYYENVLLEQEKIMAAKYGMLLLSFPMSSILGQKFGDNYQSNAVAAAEAIASAPNKVYLHCYLGLHRSKAVLDLLKDQNIKLNTSVYSVRQGERSQEDLLSDEIDMAFAEGHYSKVLELVPYSEKLEPSKALIRSWSLYRMGRFSEAKKEFASILSDKSDQIDAILGSGFSSMQVQDLNEAEKLFTRAIELSPENSDAWTGLGITHYRSGLHTKAHSALQRAVELNPNNTEAANLLLKLQQRS